MNAVASAIDWVAYNKQCWLCLRFTSTTLCPMSELEKQVLSSLTYELSFSFWNIVVLLYLDWSFYSSLFYYLCYLFVRVRETHKQHPVKYKKLMLNMNLIHKNISFFNIPDRLPLREKKTAQTNQDYLCRLLSSRCINNCLWNSCFQYIVFYCYCVTRSNPSWFIIKRKNNTRRVVNNVVENKRNTASLSWIDGHKSHFVFLFFILYYILRYLILFCYCCWQNHLSDLLIKGSV